MSAEENKSERVRREKKGGLHTDKGEKRESKSCRVMRGEEALASGRKFPAKRIRLAKIITQKGSSHKKGHVTQKGGVCD